MITSTSTAIQDFNFLESLGDNIDVQNAQTQNLLDKYGSIENFKQAFRNETQGQNFDSNLPITSMAEGAMSSSPNLRELPTGDAGMAESMSPQLPEGTRFQDNIGNIGKFIDRSDKKLPTSEDFTEEGFLKRPFVGLMPDFERMGKRSERKKADRETGLEALEFGKTNPLEAYAAGLIDKSDLSLADQARVLGDDFQEMMADMNRKKATAKGLGMNVGILGLTKGQESELAKRQEILAMAERMNPGDPDAGRKALDEYLLKQKTKLDDQDKVINVEEFKVTPLDDSKFKGETPKDPEPVRKKDINPNNLVDGIKNKDVADDTKNTIVENAPSSLKKLAKNFGDALFNPDNKGGIAAIFIGANMMNEANFGDAITKGLAQTSDFLQATGGKASDKQVVTLEDGRIVLVNKKTGAIEDTGARGKGTEEPAAIRTLNAKAEILGIDVKDLLQFELTKGDDTYEERVQKIASKIISTSIVPLEPKDAVNQAKDLIEEIDKLSSSTIDNLLEQEG
jgi:hypothetical protein